MAAPKGPRPGGRNHPRTPQNIANFVKQGVEQVQNEQKAPSPSELTVTPHDEVIGMHPAEFEGPVQAISQSPVYQAPKQDPWEILKRSLPPEALAALEEVTGKAKEPAPGNAPWFRCYDVREGRPSGHPDFQAIVKPGQHVFCPYVGEDGVACGRHTVMPLENYVPVSA